MEFGEDSAANGCSPGDATPTGYFGRALEGERRRSPSPVLLLLFEVVLLLLLVVVVVVGPLALVAPLFDPSTDGWPGGRVFSSLLESVKKPNQVSAEGEFE